mgnify:CR=1 FL=1
MDGANLPATDPDAFVYLYDKLPDEVRAMITLVRERYGDDALDAAVRAGLGYLSKAGDYHGPLRIYGTDVAVRQMANQRLRLRRETAKSLAAVARETGLARRKITILAIHYSRTCRVGSVIALEFPYRSARSR